MRLPQNKQIHLHIIGTGLIGTSIALALKSYNPEIQICVRDVDTERLALAQALIKEDVICTGNENVEIVFISTPPEVVVQVLSQNLIRYPSAIFIETASTKTNLQLNVELLSEYRSRLVFSHPIAGREVNGPASARADLFLGRAWILCHPDKESENEAYQLAREVLQWMGAVPYAMDFAEHDFLFAQISHLPQIISTAVASTLPDINSGVDLAGQGLRDMTRLASSESKLWIQIIRANKENILVALANYQNRLKEFYQYIDKDQYSGIEDLFKKGAQGRKLISGKHGQVLRNYINFQIVIDDSPGVLARLFVLCGKIEVNIEDLQLEHSPNQETGLITLSVTPDHRVILAAELTRQKWQFFIKDEIDED